jgi:hypothetical protein
MAVYLFVTQAQETGSVVVEDVPLLFIRQEIR